MKIKTKEFFIGLWGRLRPALINWLEKYAVKWVLKKLVINVGGFKAWLVTFVVKEVIEEADEHIIEPAFRKVGYILEVRNGKKIYKRTANAQDVDDWRDSTNEH